MYWVIFVVLFAGGYYYYMQKMLKAKRDQADAFLASHPDAARVYLQTGMKGLTSDATTVIDVDGEAPVHFYEGRKQGILVEPGKRVLNVAYAWTRPGILHKNVTTEVEPSRQEVEVEAKKSYILGFDKKAEAFVFTEKPEQV